MPVNSMNTVYPPQPDNPNDEQRHFLAQLALAQRNRLEDYGYILNLTSPPPNITTIASPGSFKGIRVGVIGGGLAGLSAAFELRKLGFDITVFEANQDRIGGRVYTYYFDRAKTLYGELGAMRIPVTHEAVWHYINLFGLKTRTFIQSNPNGLMYLRGSRSRSDPESVKRNIYPKFNLTNMEKSMTWQQLISYGYDSHLLCAPPNQRAEIIQVKPRYSPFTLYWDAISNRQILERSNLSVEAINLLSSIYPLAGNLLYNSYIDFIQENYPVNLTYLYEIYGGTVKLPLALYNSFFSDDISRFYPDIPGKNIGNVKWKSGCPVTGIYKGAGSSKVMLEYRSFRSPKSFCEEFDYIVCAVPFSTLRNIVINPLFSPGKMQAIKEVTYVNALKSVLLCSKRFWEKGGPTESITGGPSYTDLPITSIWYPSHKPLSEEKGVLLVYNFNQDSVRLGNLPGDLQVEEIKREIEKVHGLKEGYLDKTALSFKTVNWNTERWQRGALCFFSPEQKRLFSYVMAEPEYDNRIFFAGEHISAIHRWMQGSLQSGMDAANGIAKACIFHKSE